MAILLARLEENWVRATDLSSVLRLDDIYVEEDLSGWCLAKLLLDGVDLPKRLER